MTAGAEDEVVVVWGGHLCGGARRRDACGRARADHLARLADDGQARRGGGLHVGGRDPAAPVGSARELDLEPCATRILARQRDSVLRIERAKRIEAPSTGRCVR